ncbi:tetratricopeptide repeat protein [Micromonospora chalcea]
MAAAVRALGLLEVPALLVVDYAENVGPIIAELFDMIVDAGAEGRVRLLLLARSTGGWWRELAEEHPKHDWVDPVPTVLTSLSDELGSARTATVWAEAINRFTERARNEGHEVDVAPGERSTPGFTRFTTTLDLYADALLRVLDSSSLDNWAHRKRPQGDPLSGVLAHERRQASAAFHGAGLTLSESQRDWAIAAVALRPAATIQAAERALADVPALAGVNPDHMRKLAETLHGLYPDSSGDQVWQAPHPDRLTDTHLLQLAGEAPSLADWTAAVIAVCSGNDYESGVQAASVLHRCLSAPDLLGRMDKGRRRVESALHALVMTYPAVYVPVVTILDPKLFEKEIIGAIDVDDSGTSRLSTEDLELLDQLVLLPGYSSSRAQIAVAVSKRLVADLRPASDTDATMLSRYAGELNNLGNRLSDAGARREALEPVEQAIQIFRQLSEDDPLLYLGGLALALNNYGACLKDVARHAEALAVAEETVTIYRRLVETDSESYLSDLAMALNNLANRLGEAGRLEECLATAEETVNIRRRLVESDRDTYLPDLAGSLNNLSHSQVIAGRIEDAVATAKEAVKIRRRLVESTPGAYAPELAMELANLSRSLSEMGLHGESIEVGEEAVRNYRMLAEENAAAYLPELALVVSNLGLSYWHRGAHERAADLTSESVATYRGLVETDPVPHLAELAMALTNNSLALTSTDSAEAAAAAAREAVNIYRGLASESTGAYLPNLTRGLAALGFVLRKAGKLGEALEAVSEATVYAHELAHRSFDAFSSLFGRALLARAQILEELGQRAEAEAIRRGFFRD